MPKRILSVLTCCLLLCVSCISASAQASDEVISEKTIVLENGDRITETITVHPSLGRGSGGNYADKTWEYETIKGIDWTYTIGGYFTWNGVSSSASDPYDDYTINDSGWTCTSHSVRAAGPSVVGKATFHHFSGMNKIPNPVLTCSANGDFS